MTFMSLHKCSCLSSTCKFIEVRHF